MRSVILKNKRNIPGLAWCILRWHLNHLVRKKPLPLACGVYITSRCNFRCSFCNIWRKDDPKVLPYPKAKALVDSLSALGSFYFSISGGEPLLVDYIFDLLSYARKSRIKYLHLVTNGYLLDEKCAIKLRGTGINEVSVSIDAEASVHDKNRGVPGAYARAVKAVENLKKNAPGINIVLNAILRPQSPTECFHVLDLARELDVYVKVQPLNQHPAFNPDNSGSPPAGGISPGRLREAVDKLCSDERVVNSRAFLKNMYNFFCDRERLIFKDSRCLFGYHHIEILEDGSVFPCLEGLGWKGGLEFGGDLKSSIDSDTYANLVKKLETCKGCQRNYYICYYEPRISFPVGNFLRSGLGL